MAQKSKFDVDEQEAVRLYTEDNESIPSIAEKMGTYHNRIRRVLLKHGVKMRDKSEAQKLALSLERTKHPTEGTHLSPETKIKISEAQGKVWDNKTEQEREAWRQARKEQMDNMPRDLFEEQHKKALEAVRESAKYGSKLERYLVQELKKANYIVELHKDHFLGNEKLKLDIFLPANNMVIEVDGPSHREEIWGEESLERQNRSDMEKNGLLLTKGYNILRVQQNSSLSLRIKRKALEIVLKYISEFKDQSGQLAIESI